MMYSSIQCSCFRAFGMEGKLSFYDKDGHEVSLDHT